MLVFGVIVDTTKNPQIASRPDTNGEHVSRAEPRSFQKHFSGL